MLVESVGGKSMFWRGKLFSVGRVGCWWKKLVLAGTIGCMCVGWVGTVSFR